ncbi:MAG: MFS transporter [Deltaproteobacteria bacterium]|nr:MFS transporter [Deltaproteobacteria bacterium]
MQRQIDLRRKLLWIGILYFAEGFPFGIVIDNLPVYFRTHGVSLTDIGLMYLLGLPWTLKVLWAPLVDRFGTYQRWIMPCLLLVGLALGLLPWFDASRPGPAIWSILGLLTLAAATQDIAIDAYTISLLGRDEEGVANGVRVSAYRAALIVAGGGLVMLAGWLGWQTVFAIAAALLAGLALILSRSPRLERRAPDVAEAWFAPLFAWMKRPGAPLVFLFVLTYKLGDASMGPMIKPFWVDRGLSVEEIGLVSTTFGVFASVVGALVGGSLTTRWGIRRSLLILGIAQAVSNLGYAAAAWFELGRPGIYSASLVESFTGGLGTAAFLAFMMRICDKRRAATEYALLSAIFGFTRQVAGAASGWATTQMGYGPYFAFTFVLALPSLALLPWVGRWTEEQVDR